MYKYVSSFSISIEHFMNKINTLEYISMEIVVPKDLNHDQNTINRIALFDGEVKCGRTEARASGRI